MCYIYRVAQKKWPPLEKMQYFFNGLRFHFKILELVRGGISTYSGQVSLKNVKAAVSFQCFNFKNIKITFWMFFCYYNTDFFNFWWFWKEPFATMVLMTTTYLSRCSVWPPPASVHNCSPATTIGADLYGPVGLEPPLIIIRWAQQCTAPPLIFSREKKFR